MITSAISYAQIKGIYEVASRDVSLTCVRGNINKGSIALPTLWTLQDKGIVTGEIIPRLTPFGEQLHRWIVNSEKYEDIE